MENGMKDFKIWLEAAAGQFKAEHYTKEEIANLAIACGFDRHMVAQWKTSMLFKEAI